MSTKPKILAVDDDERTRRLIVAMLTPHGYDVVLAERGKEVIDIARKQKPSLILLDIMMPEMDGYTVLSALKSNNATRKIPVLMVTALGYELNKELADEMGAAGYITKPLDLQELLDAITRQLPSR